MKAHAHRKKRNVGLLYEFLVATLAKSTIDGDRRTSSRALRILRRHFKPGTQLYSEFRLINALRSVKVSSESVAANVLREAKRAAQRYDLRQLEREKSLLIKDINHVINDPNFYDHPVNEYRLLATIQTLVDDWRSPRADIARIADYEDQVLRHLTAPVVTPSERVVSDRTVGEGRVLMKLLMKRLNERYDGVLSQEQRSLIGAYVSSNDPAQVRERLEIVRGTLLERMTAYVPDGDSMVEKLNGVREKLLSEDLGTIDDRTMTRFMAYVKLSEELSSEDDDA